MNSEHKGIRNNYCMVTIVWDNNKYKVTKEQFMNKLKQYNIDSRLFFYPLSMEPGRIYL